MTYATLRYEVSDGLLLLTLNRPEQLNAFTVEMANELVDAYTRANADDAVQAIVVTGEGRAFCAGMDLSVGGNVFGLDESLTPTLQDMRERLDDPSIHHGVRDTGGRVALAMFNCLKPIVGAINGAAVGIGATMTLPMDFRFASETARIGFVFGRLGITPEACSTWFLPRIVGMEQALEWLYRADIFTASEACEKGLVRAVVPPEQLLETACAFASSLIADRSPVSIALIRQMLYRNSALPDPLEAHRIESLAMFYTSINDGKEGVRAFNEKRPAEFSGKASSMPPFYPWFHYPNHTETNSMAPTGFSFTKMIVADLAAAKRFYTETMGLKVVLTFATGEGSDQLEEAILSQTGTYNGGHSLALVQYLNRPPARPGEAIFGFSVEDVDATIKAVIAAGGALARPARTIPEHNIKVAFVTDPEGHLLEIVQMLPTTAA